MIEAACAQDLAAIDALLREMKLPSGDLNAAKLAHFLVLRGADGRSLAGAIGFEPYGSVALLRSLVVAPAHRGVGHGEALAAAIEARARRFGIAELFLLTTTAPEFFVRLGYVGIERASAPTALQTTTEFVSLCPASATCMHKTL